MNSSNLEYKIYRIGWSWWWENSGESFGTYINNSSITPVASGNLQTRGGKASFKFRIDYPSWGRYLVYVKDKESGHATGGTVYVDWPEWRGRSSKTDPSGIKMLAFSLNKCIRNWRNSHSHYSCGSGRTCTGIHRKRSYRITTRMDRGFQRRRYEIYIQDYTGDDSECISAYQSVTASRANSQ